MVSALDRDDRGQLLLLGAIGISLVIVGTVVLLNGMAFDDSIGARNTDDDLGEAQRTVDMIETDLNSLARELRTDVEPGSGDFVAWFRENVSVFSRHYTNMSFDDGIVYTRVRFAASDSINGTTVWQTARTPQGPCDKGDPYPRFTIVKRGRCVSDPTIARDATEVSQFNLTVEGAGTGSAPRTDLVVTDGAETWRLTFATQANGSIVVDERAPRGTSRVGVFRPTFEVELRDDGRLTVGDGEPVTFADGVSQPYDVGFENAVSGGGTALTGTYSLATDGAPPSGLGSQPETYDTVVSPAVEIYYQRREVTFNRTVVLNETGAR